MVRMGYVPSIAGGGIGINRTSIGARLHIQHDGNGALRHMVKLANNGSGQGTGAQINMGASTADEQYSASIAGFYDNPGTSFIIKTAGTYANQSTVAERFRIKPTGQIITNGNVTTYPSRSATFRPPSGQTQNYVSIIAGNTTSSTGLTFGDNAGAVAGNYAGMIEYHNNGDNMRFYTNSVEKLRIDKDGNTNIVGILTASNFDYTTNRNIRIGAGAAHTTTRYNIIAIGEGAVQNVTSDNIVALGYNAGNSQTSGSSNTYIGSYAGEKITNKNANTFVGDTAGRYVTSHSNTAVGAYALRNFNGGSQSTYASNCAFGRDSMRDATTASTNAAYGNGSLQSVGGGQSNAAFGHESLKDCSGQYNTGVGRFAGKGLSTGQKNTILGAWFTGTQLTTGTNNTLLGFNATPTSITVSNEITLGDTNVTKFRIPGIGVTLTDGIVTIPTPVIDVSGDVTVGGNFKVVGVSTFSDDVTFTTANSKNIVFDKSDNTLEFGDNVKATFGDSKDLSIYHNGTNSYIEDSNGSAHFNILSHRFQILNQAGNESMARFYANGAAELYFNNNLKFETNNTGINVTGLTDTDTLTTGNATFTGSVSAGSTTGIDGYYLKSTGIGVTWAVLPSSRTGLTTSATAGQTTFNFSYNIGFVDVFLNGVKLPSSEFTASNGSTIVLDDAAFANDTLEFISLNTVPVSSSGGAQNLTGLADVTISGTPVIGETLQHNGNQFVNDYTVSTTTTSTSQTAILNLPVATYRSAEYTIQVTEGTKYHVTKVLAIHDGTNVTFNEYGTLTTSTSLSTFALDVNSGNMRLLATPASTNSTVFKVKFTGIKV
jgi:hypothetical protein